MKNVKLKTRAISLLMLFLLQWITGILLAGECKQCTEEERGGRGDKQTWKSGWIGQNFSAETGDRWFSPGYYIKGVFEGSGGVEERRPAWTRVVSKEVRNGTYGKEYQLTTEIQWFGYPEFVTQQIEEDLPIIQWEGKCYIYKPAGIPDSSESKPGDYSVSAPSMSNVESNSESQGCSSCKPQAEGGNFEISLSLGSDAFGGSKLSYSKSLGAADMLDPSALTLSAATDAYTGSLESGTVALNDAVTGQLISTTTVSVSNDLISITITPADVGIPPTTHILSKVADGVYEGLKYTRQQGDEVKVREFTNASAAPSLPDGRVFGTFQTKDENGDRRVWTAPPEIDLPSNGVPTFTWEVDANLADGGYFVGTHTEQEEFIPNGMTIPSITKIRYYQKIGTPTYNKRVLIAEVTNTSGPTSYQRTELYGYDRRRYLINSTYGTLYQNPAFGDRIWTASSDGAWKLKVLEEMPNLASPGELLYGDAFEFTPWKGGPPLPSGFADVSNFTATQTFFSGLIADAKGPDANYNLAQCRRVKISDKSVQSGLSQAWQMRRVESIWPEGGSGVTVGMDRFYNDLPESGSGNTSYASASNVGVSAVMKSRSERWNAAGVGGWNAAGAQCAWNARFESSRTEKSISLDQTGLAQVTKDVANLDTGSMTRFNYRVRMTPIPTLVYVANAYQEIVLPYSAMEMPCDYWVLDEFNAVTSAYPLISSQTMDANTEITSEASLWRAPGGTTDTPYQTINTTRSGKTAYTRSSGSQVLDSQLEDSIAEENNVQVRTSTRTDAQGLTTVTKTNEDTGELISVTRKGVAGFNTGSGGYEAQPDVITSYTKSTDATTGEVTQTVMQTAGAATRTLSVTVTDVLGRTKSVTDEIGRVTTYDYSTDGRETTETLPGGLTRITTTYLDGQLKSITGTAVVPEFHDYTVNDGTNADYEAGSITETVWTGWNGTGSAPPEAIWRKTTTNFLGWMLREEESLPVHMGGSMARLHTYNAKGQRVSTEELGASNGLVTTFEYDDWGNLKKQTRGSQVAQTDTTFVVEGGIVLEKTTQTQGEGPTAKITITRRTLKEGDRWVKTTHPDGKSTLAETISNREMQLWVDHVSDPDENVTLHASAWYNGRMNMQKEEYGHTQNWTTFAYNGFGQMTSRNDPATGLSSWDYDPATGQLLTETPAGGSAITYAYHPVTSAAAGRLASRTANGAVTRYDYHHLGGLSHQWGNGAQPLRYEYDALGRLTALHTYQNEWGWDSTEKPAAFSSPLGDDSEMTQWEYYPGSNLLHRKIINSTPVAEYGYDGAGRVTSVTQANSNPSSRTYDSSGRLETIEPNSSETPTVTYTYQPDGSLATVSDAAGLHRFTTDPTTGVTTETIEAGPSGSLLAGIAITRKQISDGRPLTVEAHFYSQSGGSTTFHTTLARHQYEWTPENRLHRAYAGARHTGAGGPGYAYEYDWDEGTGRLGGILSQPVSGSAPAGLHAADRYYGYTPAGGRVETLHYNTRPLAATGPGQSVLGYHYTHDTHGRRQQVQPYLPNAAPPAAERPPGWEWAYNDRGEVENAARFTAAGGPVNGVVPSQTRAYSYDRMGNRLSFTQGSGAEAITTQTPFQSINKSQQILRIMHDRKVELSGAVAAGSLGIVSAGAVGTVDQGLAQLGEPGGFRTLVQLNSPDGAMLRTTVSSGGTEKEGYLYVPPAEEVLDYDQRGNLLRDARWEYTWDVENRLVELNEYPLAVMNEGYRELGGHFPCRRIRFAYDYMSRRIAKTVWVWSGPPNNTGRWRLEKDLRYVYDGWQMIAELDHTFAPPTAGWQPAMTWPSYGIGTGLDPASAQEGFGGFTGISGVAAERCVVRTYLWGQDLSGTMTGAGGVGGLLSVTHQGVTYHTCTDANGNITGLLAADGADAGKLIARFDYDPFGNRLTNTGPDVEICPMGFSTKYTDSETGLVDYGLRIYSPPMARFLSRDPIGERGGVNLYGFVGNDPVNNWDYLGLSESSDFDCNCCIAKSYRVHFYNVTESQYIDVTADSKYNHMTGRIYSGTLCVTCKNGNIRCWDIKSGGYRMKESSIRGPTDADPVGDDSSIPQGDYKVETSPTGGTNGYEINGIFGRDLIKIHFNAGLGSHGCVTTGVPTDWEEIKCIMSSTRKVDASVPIHVRYALPNDMPRGENGRGRSSSGRNLPDPPDWPEPNPFDSN